MDREHVKDTTNVDSNVGSGKDNNVPTKTESDLEHENRILRDKIKYLEDNNLGIDGRPLLTDGEAALIKALRATKLAHVWELYGSHIVGVDYDNHVIESFDNHIAFITDSEHDDNDKAIIAALKQIQQEQYQED